MTKEEIEALKNRSFDQSEGDKYKNAVRLCDHLNAWFGMKATKHKKKIQVIQKFGNTICDPFINYLHSRCCV